MKILITGSSGFIGYHASLRFLNEGYDVVGLDIENDYYDVELKKTRRERLLGHDSKRFTFVKHDLFDAAIKDVLAQHDIKNIINLAAQAGVRHSLEHPEDYVKSNVNGFLNLLEYAKSQKDFEHIVFASTSSVYGANTQMPFSEEHGVDHPLQFYAASKRMNELMAHAYSNLYGIAATGLRFFTVYGPWGRPDMALFMFTKNILEGKPITIFNNGNHSRDFTYVDDIVDGIYRAFKTKPESSDKQGFNAKNPSESYCPYRILNIGAGRQEQLEDFVSEIENCLGKKAIREYLPLQPGDVPDTSASISKLQDLGYESKTSIKEGVKNFVDWYVEYYHSN